MIIVVAQKTRGNEHNHNRDDAASMAYRDCNYRIGKSMVAACHREVNASHGVWILMFVTDLNREIAERKRRNV